MDTRECTVAKLAAEYAKHVAQDDAGDQMQGIGDAALMVPASSMAGAFFQVALASSLLDFFAGDDSLRALMDKAFSSAAKVMLAEIGDDDVSGRLAEFFFSI